MKTKILVAIILSSFAVYHFSFAQGSLTPSGAPSPTMKSLAQIEPRTQISSAPFTITQPGSYYLTANLTTTSNAITIATNGVSLDLNGFALRSTAPSAAGYGILLNSGLRNITLANGFIEGSVTNNGSGILGGSGFSSGITCLGTPPVNVLVYHISVSGCLNNGIFLSTGDSTVVESCTVRTVGFYGIYASTIKQSSAVDCASVAITGDQVSDCRGESISSTGISAITVEHSYGYGGGGHGVVSVVAENCYGQSINGYGIQADTTQNCNGYATGSGSGVIATIAQNCYGQSVSGFGIDAFHLAIGCSGYSSSGTGMSSFIANICHGATSTGTALTTTHNINSY